MWKRVGCEYRVSHGIFVVVNFDTICCRIKHPRHPSFKAVAGYSREEAIMVLRRFYMTENVNGKFDILSFDCGT